MLIQRLITLIPALFCTMAGFAQANIAGATNALIAVNNPQNQPINATSGDKTIIYIPNNSPVIQKTELPPQPAVINQKVDNNLFSNTNSDQLIGESEPTIEIIPSENISGQKPVTDDQSNIPVENGTIEWVDEKSPDRPKLSDYSNSLNESSNTDPNDDPNIITNEISQNTNPDVIESEADKAGWFTGSEEPEILKKREKKTKFGKHDRYYGKHLCDNGMYTCIALKKGDNWQNLFPDKYQRQLVQRINRTNQGLWGRSWILVPNDINRNYMDFSPLPDFWDNDGQKTIVIDVSELAFAAYDEDGDLVNWGPVNPGREASQTVHGKNFQVYRKGGAECWSKKFEANIPYCIFFHKGYAIHGFTMPGYAASHGCVRVYTDDALWLNKNFVDFKTKVIVQK